MVENTNYFNSLKSYIPNKSDLNTISENNFYELQKLATAFKDDNQWDNALLCLYKAKLVSIQENFSPELQYTTRLALFLQQAGLFEESKSELQALFNNVDNYVHILLSNQRTNQAILRRKYKAIYLENLFDKARLIYKREQQIEQATIFKDKRDEYRKQEKHFDEILSEQTDIELEEFYKEIEEDIIAEKLITPNKNIQSKNKISTKQETMEGLVGLIIIIIILWFIFK
ncbi:hypothetical protein FW755_03285 [Lonepinella koalarum]|uniref:hypothetical protein n=1 Tax=Lonepinella koalarum TaxID=53417 RepID=UPI0011E3F665|nr:hypothetical protein [Lonepinella koalarum]TYG34181.1 hypothetical protein FW755_03285 [Lonepinella koalarum]